MTKCYSRDVNEAGFVEWRVPQQEGTRLSIIFSATLGGDHSLASLASLARDTLIHPISTANLSFPVISQEKGMGNKSI